MKSWKPDERDEPMMRLKARMGERSMGVELLEAKLEKVEQVRPVLKENRSWERTFTTIAELRQALREFKSTHNQTWWIECHGVKRPVQAWTQRMQEAPA